MKQKEQILKHVSKVYRKYGIKSVTMDDVSRELGISKRTLYQYVQNKRDLVEQVVNYELYERKCRSSAIKQEDMNAVDELLAVNRHIIQMMREHNPSLDYDLRKYYPDLERKLRQNMRKSMYEAVLRNIRKGQEEGIFRTDLNADIIARLQVSRFESTMDNDVFSMEELTSPDFVFEVFIYHIRGIANRKGLDLLEHRLGEINKTELLHGNLE